MTVTPTGIQVGPILLYYFGLILLVALIVGGFFARLRAKQQGLDTGLVIDLIIWAVIVGVIFARALYIWNPPPSVAEIYDRRWFLAHPFDLQVGPLAIWSGGLSMAGALIGGLIGVTLTLLRRRADGWRWGDVLAPAVLLGMFVAAWANVANQQMVGPPTTLPWGLAVSNPVPPFTPDERFHPTPAYLAIWAIITLIIVLWLESRQRLRKGMLLLWSILSYTPGLFLADFLRVDVNRVFLGLTDMQVISLILFLIAGLLLLIRSRASVDNTTDAAIPPVPTPDAG